MDVRLVNGGGFSAEADRLEALINKGVFRKEGNTFWIGEEKIGVRSKLTSWAKENPERLKEL